MSLALFKELERLVGKEHMKNLCQDYLAKGIICSDASGSRMWKDCSGEKLDEVKSVAVYPQQWSAMPELKTPPKIRRTLLHNSDLS